jgi:uncharacterized membrane protein
MRAVEPVPGRLAGADPSATAGALAWCAVRRWTLVVWGGAVVWSAALFATVRSDYLGFRLARFDLGNMVQAVWSTAHGRPLEMTSFTTGQQVARLAFHVDPILALLTPLWIVAPSPLTLAAAQIVACALGAPPVFWLARRHLQSEPVAACLALAYLAYPWLAWSASDPIHPVTFAIPLFLYAIWFLDSDRLWAFAPFAVLAALCGELMGLSVAALGIWYALARGQRTAGACIAVLGVVWSVVAVELIVPALLDGPSIYYERYAAVGGSPGGVLRTLFTDPGTIVSALTTRDDVLFLVLLAAPLLGAFLLAPILAAVAIPTLLVDGLSSARTMVDPRYHYVAGLVPFLVAATVLGLARLSARGRLRGATAILGISLLTFVAAGPVVKTNPRTRFESGRSYPATHIAALRAAVALVPDGAPVTSTNAVGASLSSRRYVYSVPAVGRAQWAVIDRWNPWMSGPNGRGLYPARLRALVERLERDPAWTTILERDGVVVLRKDEP